MRADGIPIGSPVDVGKIPQREYDLRSWTDLNSGPGYRRIPADQVSGERKPFSLGVNPSPSAPEAVTPNGWHPIIQSTLTHPDDHLPKLQRSLSEYAIHFGLTPAGTFKNTELKDAELIDGTLFIRAAGLTLSRLGWVREGQAPGSWDSTGFFDLASKL